MFGISSTTENYTSYARGDYLALCGIALITGIALASLPPHAVSSTIGFVASKAIGSFCIVVSGLIFWRLLSNRSNEEEKKEEEKKEEEPSFFNSLAKTLEAKADIDKELSNQFLTKHAEQISSNIDEQDDNGETLLHKAAQLGHVHAVTVLLEKGAKPELKDKAGNTAWHAAALANKQNIIMKFSAESFKYLNDSNQSAAGLLLASLAQETQEIQENLNTRLKAHNSAQTKVSDNTTSVD